MPRRCAVIAVAAVLLSGPSPAHAEDVLRDPTRPYNVRPVGPTSSNSSGATSFRVTAILTSEKRRIAVVNGQRVAEGDQVDGATVVEILTDRLRLDNHGKAITRSVLPYGFRK